MRLSGFALQVVSPLIDIIEVNNQATEYVALGETAHPSHMLNPSGKASDPQCSESIICQGGA